MKDGYFAMVRAAGNGDLDTVHQCTKEKKCLLNARFVCFTRWPLSSR